MAIHKVSSEFWSKLSEDDKQKFVSRMKLKGLFAEGDSIEGSDEVTFKKVQINKRAGCPDFCNEWAQEIYNATGDADLAAQEYMECCIDLGED